MRRAAVLFLGVLLVVGARSPVGAQVAVEQVVSLDIDITVNADGSADFVEHIDYDFGANERHGIYRDLRVKQRFDGTHDRTYPLQVVEVAAVDAPADYVIIDGDDAGDTRIRIGDPDVTITGRHLYTIRYRLAGVVNELDAVTDELYWNVTGDDWEVPIGHTSVAVHLPTPVTGVMCFAGYRTDAPCASSTIGADGSSAAFAATELWPSEELTVVVGFEDADGAAVEPQPILTDRFNLGKAFEPTPVTVGAGSALALALAGLIARLQYRVGRDRRAFGSPTDIAFAPAGAASEAVPLFAGESSPVEFVPPDRIRPGQLGLLRDEVVHTADVSATIVDLAVRGYIRIEEVVDKDGDVDDYRFVRLAKNGGLLSYEGYLLTELFERGPEVELSTLKNKFAKSLGEVRKQIYMDAVARGWFDARPDHVRTKWLLLGVAVEAVGIGLTVLLAVFTHLALLGVPIVVAGLALMIGSRWMPRRTAAGHGVYRRILGFEDFIENSEKHRAQWAERRNLFTEYLPYAIALGATKKWARTLEALGAPPPQAGGWYVGHSPYGWSGFGDRMAKFSSSTSTTLASTPGGSGSSGFSGGSSGGGGGGGGGGSW
jgi:uncharacterized membrane protein YgcG